MSGTVVGLDVGGANLKYALVRDGADGPEARLVGSGLLPFALWEAPERLEARLGEVRERLGSELRGADGGPRVALVMTGELVDAFATRAEGVRHIVDAADAAFPDAVLRLLGLDGAWLAPGDARRAPAEVASANWRATAAWLARGHGDVLLADMGSTTTDLVPVAEGRVGTGARGDLERLRSGELVYTGLLRTPVSAMLPRVELDGTEVGLAAERFAVAADVHLWLGSLEPEAYRCEPPDGGERTREAAGRRLARMLCSDPGELGRDGITALARQAAEAQASLVVEAVGRLRRALGRSFPGRACPTGAGADLLAAHLRRAGLDLVDPPPALAPPHAAASTAAAAALLLAAEEGP